MTFILHAPQIIWIILMTISFFAAFALNNKVIETEDVITNSASRISFIFSSLFTTGIGFLLLLWGGAFKTIGIPQTLTFITYGLSLLDSMFFVANPKPLNYPRTATMISNLVVNFGIVYWMGFFSGQ